MRVEGWVSKDGLQLVYLLYGQRVLLVVGFLVDLVERHACFVRQVVLQQPMGACNLDGQPLAFRGYCQVSSAGFDQALGFHTSKELERIAVAQSEAGFERGGKGKAIFPF